MGSRHGPGGIPWVRAQSRAPTFITAIVVLLLACPSAFGRNVPRNFDEAYALYNNTVDDIGETGKKKCFDAQTRDALLGRIDQAVSQLKQFALNEGLKLTTQPIINKFGKVVTPGLSAILKKPPSQFSDVKALEGWTNFMIGRLKYLRGKIASTPACQPPSAPPPPPKEVTPQCQPLPANAEGLKAELQTLFQKVKKTVIFIESSSQFEIERVIQALEQESHNRESLIKQVEENPGKYTPEDQHPATYLEGLKEAQKQAKQDLEILRRMLELRSKLDELSYNRCPETGLYAGLEGAKNWGRQRTTERDADTDEITNEFTDNRDPLGGGVVVGYNFRPWSNNIVFGPFGSFDWLDQTIKHTFPGGSFLGTRSNWIATVGGKAGITTPSGVFLYGLAGAGWLNTDLNVKFATASSRTTTVSGFTLGAGGEYQPSTLRIFGAPVSVFLQYQHSWWQDADFNKPASSPTFNYTFEREDDTIKLGLNLYFGR
jgi:opacity protein-like surface antigen